MKSLKTDYADWPRLTDIFPWQHSGVQVKRKWPIAEVPEVLVRRWETMVGLPFEERRVAFRETGDRNIGRTYRDIFTSEKLTPIASLESNAEPMAPVRYGNRSFDRQWILPDNRAIDRPRPSIWSQSDSQLYVTSLLTTHTWASYSFHKE